MAGVRGLAMASVSGLAMTEREGFRDGDRGGTCWTDVKMSCGRAVCAFLRAELLHGALDCDPVAFWTAAMLSCKTGEYSARLTGLLGD